MISKSDNTATDHLLFFLGRKRIEAMMATMGHSQPSLNYPFLSTREAFLLQDPEAPKRLKDYISLDTTHRRAYLDKVLAKLSRKDLRSVHSQPTAITQVEWFASAADLCRAMDWFRTLQATKNQPGAVDILAINRGLSFQEKRWSYIGYKGGSEPGVLNLTWLLRRAGDNQWLALSAGWNNDQTNLDEDKLIEVIQGLIVLLER
jgi:beta-lactamase class A